MFVKLPSHLERAGDDAMFGADARKEHNENEVFYWMFNPKGREVPVCAHLTQEKIKMHYRFSRLDDEGNPLRCVEKITPRKAKEKPDPALMMAEAVTRLVEQGAKKDDALGALVQALKATQSEIKKEEGNKKAVKSEDKTNNPTE